jgi:hypothetical protein
MSGPAGFALEALAVDGLQIKVRRQSVDEEFRNRALIRLACLPIAMTCASPISSLIRREMTSVTLDAFEPGQHKCWLVEDGIDGFESVRLLAPILFT